MGPCVSCDRMNTSSIFNQTPNFSPNADTISLQSYSLENENTINKVDLNTYLFNVTGALGHLKSSFGISERSKPLNFGGDWHLNR